jgi:hypothetical protein
LTNDLNKTIKQCLKFFDVTATILDLPFQTFRKIPKEHRGVYIITSAEIRNNDPYEIIYVGKGNIRMRQFMHTKKTQEKLKPSTVMPAGWEWLKENRGCVATHWHVYYMHLNSETELSAMEGALIHRLQPLANEETHRDRKKNG